MNKYKKLALNTVVFAIGVFGSKILVILLTRLYAHNIDDVNSGVKDLLETTLLLIQPVFTFALQEYLIRFGLDKAYDKREVFTTSSMITLAGMALMAVCVPIMRGLPALNFLKGYTLLFIAYTAMSSLRMLCQNFVRSRDMVKLFSLDGILTTLTFFLFNIMFISKMHMGVKGFLLAVILSDSCSVVFLFVAAKLRDFMNREYFNPDLAKEMMRFAGPLIPTIVMWAITSLSDRLFLRVMHSDYHELGEGAVGLYGYANKIPNLISVVSTIFFQAWSMSAITENDSADRNKFYERVFSAYEAIMFMAGAGLLLIIKPVTSFLVPSDTFAVYENVYIYTPILVVAVIFMCFNQFLGSIYTATKHPKNACWTALVACGINIPMNYFLIPLWGIQGAAVATLLSYLICFWARIIDARYYVPFKFNAIKNLINTGVLMVMAVLVIGSPKLYLLWVFLLFAYIMFTNYQAIIDTAKKLLKRS
ncbi:polysaccharide biosynthesis C-terminal domain-containing protein [Ruminococcus sp.]|uniref:lipopolysaccharide biosynthesis protein n=1 Tax=Ruminococcus sp. TaxID=41978 RepID=UPI0025ECAFC9|nr:polysaccharide biosynthesis C-terminal domain-containing protein [Ruminococcus sp.]MBQ6252766.1 polysaccharide biosynthesis C-terminal domain-containing protein [Ruminococcus sp.]